MAFTIMEMRRERAKGLKPEWEEEMRESTMYRTGISGRCQKDQVHVPESPCGGLRYDGLADRLL